MANLTTYTNATVWVAGAGNLTQENSVTVELKGGVSPVFTTMENFAGATPGAKTAEITIENAVPSADFELNPDLFMQAMTPVEVHINTDGRTAVFHGYLTDATFNHTVNESAKLSLKILARYAPFE